LFLIEKKKTDFFMGFFFKGWTTLGKGEKGRILEECPLFSCSLSSKKQKKFKTLGFCGHFQKWGIFIFGGSQTLNIFPSGI